MTQLATAPTPSRHSTDSNLSHEVCCADENLDTGRISMCGIPIEDGELDPDLTPSCLVCQDLLEQWAIEADTYGEQIPCRACPKKRSN